MNLKSMPLLLIWIKAVTALHCRCTGLNCISDFIDTCYTTRSCFTKTVNGRYTSYGCIHSIGMEALFCNSSQQALTSFKCCSTEMCNSIGFPHKPYLPVPSVKLAGLVKRRVTVYITDSFGYRSNIDGYVATIYTPGTDGMKVKTLAPDTRIFSFDYLFVNTRYVVEVTSFRGNFSSERSRPVVIKTKTPVCDYYKRGDQSTKTKESCTAFGCFSTWNKNGTVLTLQERGCWNDAYGSKCLETHMMPNSISFVICTCDKRSCTPKKTT